MTTALTTAPPTATPPTRKPNRLSRTARAELKGAGITPADWSRRFFGDPAWGGDACGCPDDRCIGYHHDDLEDCGCLAALLADVRREAQQ